MLDAVDSAGNRRPDAWQVGGMGGNRHPPCRGNGDRTLHLAHRPRRRVAVRPFDVELDEVGAVVELLGDRGLDAVAVLRRNRETKGSGPFDPAAGRPEVRPVAASPPGVADGQRQRTVVAPRRPDVPEPADAGSVAEVAVLLGDLQQFLSGVIDAFDPMRPTGKGRVAVGVDQTGHHRCPTGVDDPLGTMRIGCVVVVTHPLDPVVDDEEALVAKELGAGAIGDGGVAIQDGHGLTLRRSPWRRPRSGFGSRTGEGDSYHGHHSSHSGGIVHWEPKRRAECLGGDRVSLRVVGER